MNSFRIFMLTALLLTPISACGDQTQDADSNLNPDGDSDTDSDSNAEIDGDTSSDMDSALDDTAGADTDTGSDTGAVARSQAPVFNTASGTYDSILSIVITSENPDAGIYYTTDGSTPNDGSHYFNAESPPLIDTTTTFNAIAIEPGLLESEVVTATYTIDGLLNITQMGNVYFTDMTHPGHVRIDGNYAYVSGHNGDTGDVVDPENYLGGLHIIDKTDPAAPFITGSHMHGGYLPWGMDYANDWVYLSNDAGGMRMIDVSDRTAPVETATYDAVILGINGIGDMLYVDVADFSGLTRLDISTPGAPTHVDTWSISGLRFPESPSASHIYGFNIEDPVETDTYHAMGVFDISGEGQPTLTGIYHIPDENNEWSASMVVPYGDYAFLSCYDRIEVIDATDKTNPVKINEIQATGHMTIFNDKLFVSTEQELHIYDISDPANVLWRGRLRHVGGASDIQADENYIYTIQHNTGFRIYAYN